MKVWHGEWKWCVIDGRRNFSCTRPLVEHEHFFSPLFVVDGIPTLWAMHYNLFWPSSLKNTTHSSCLRISGYSLWLNDALLSLGLSGAFSLLSFWQDWLLKGCHSVQYLLNCGFILVSSLRLHFVRGCQHMLIFIVRLSWPKWFQYIISSLKELNTIIVCDFVFVFVSFYISTYKKVFLYFLLGLMCIHSHLAVSCSQVCCIVTSWVHCLQKGFNTDPELICWWKKLKRKGRIHVFFTFLVFVSVQVNRMCPLFSLTCIVKAHTDIFIWAFF